MSVPSSPSSPSLPSDVPPAHEYHPDFCTTASAPDFDVVIVSSDDVHFIVSANVLKSTSTPFRDAFGISQKSGADSDKQPVRLNDLEASTLSILLRMLTGQKLPYLGDLDVIGTLLFAAEKYEMDGPLSILRNCLKAHCYEDPLRLYRIGCHFRWREIISLASRCSLEKIDIFSDQSRAALGDILPVHILEIQDLHRHRINAVTDQALWAPDGPILKPWGTKRCKAWYKFDELRYFKEEISTRIKGSPAGHFISDKSFSKSYTAVNLRDAYCSKCKRAHVNVDKILDTLGERLR